ncbi:hypothetical protein NTGBS_170038 [Candidatus Nitrotoga sp. BS]|nr:hypothetical protein NTGBS_170038 [Candidatus Nitrotoga sp. BS]
MNVLKRLETREAGWNNCSVIIRAYLSRVYRVGFQFRHRAYFFVADNARKVIGMGTLGFRANSLVLWPDSAFLRNASVCFRL